MAILRQESDPANLIDDDGVSEVSLLIVPWATNILALRPNGTFVILSQPLRTF
ncbi:hypothetical protein V1517DRAFT_37520 [Lipomyces orientalis]|uniref:Uncharacterized protein n=1 Tax=Lipomyces orientalis TaxID=1233043 RepID=A0ACC3TF56_9ASCO